MSKDKKEWKRHFARERQRRYRARIQQQALESAADTYRSSTSDYPSAPSDYPTLLPDHHQHLQDTFASGSNSHLNSSYQPPSTSGLYNLTREQSQKLHPDPSSMTGEDWKRYLARERQRRFRARNQQSQLSSGSTSSNPQNQSSHSRSSSLPVNQSSNYVPTSTPSTNPHYNPPSDPYSSSSVMIPSDRNQSINEIVPQAHSSNVVENYHQQQQNRRSYHQGSSYIMNASPHQRISQAGTSRNPMSSNIDNNNYQDELQPAISNYSRYPSQARHDMSTRRDMHSRSNTEVTPHSNNNPSSVNPHHSSYPDNYHSSYGHRQADSDRSHDYRSSQVHPSSSQRSSSRISIGNLIHPHDLSDHSQYPCTTSSCSKNLYEYSP